MVQSEQKVGLWYQRGLISKLTKINRSNRSKKIIELLEINSNTSILDVGCGPDSKSILDIINQCKNIIGIDLFDSKYLKTKNNKFKYLQMDARDLSLFKNNQFDVGLNFGMMEHIAEPNRTIIMEEMFRVCRKVAIVVPHKYSFIEPHFKLPFFSLYPLWLSTSLVTLFRLHVNGMKSYKKTKERLQNEYFWLSSSQWESYLENAKSYNIFLGPILLNLLVIYNCENK